MSEAPESLTSGLFCCLRLARKIVLGLLKLEEAIVFEFEPS